MPGPIRGEYSAANQRSPGDEDHEAGAGVLEAEVVMVLEVASQAPHLQLREGVLPVLVLTRSGEWSLYEYCGTAAGR